MDYRYEIAQLLKLNVKTTAKLLKSALKNPILGEAIALTKNVGFDAENNDSWGIVYLHVCQLLQDRESFQMQAKKPDTDAKIEAYKVIRSRIDYYRILNLPNSNKYVIAPEFWQQLAIDVEMTDVKMELSPTQELMLKQSNDCEIIETYEGIYREYRIQAFLIDAIVEYNADKVDVLLYRERVTLLQNAMNLEIAYLLS